MKKDIRVYIYTLLVMIVALTISFTYAPQTDQAGTENSSGDQITAEDVTGVWINHHNKDIKQQIIFSKNHHWRENQHGIKNIYSGTWKIVGKRTILLAPYDEKIVFNKHDFNQINVISYHHILNKEK